MEFPQFNLDSQKWEVRNFAYEIDDVKYYWVQIFETEQEAMDFYNLHR